MVTENAGLFHLVAPRFLKTSGFTTARREGTGIKEHHEGVFYESGLAVAPVIAHAPWSGTNSFGHTFELSSGPTGWAATFQQHCSQSQNVSFGSKAWSGKGLGVLPVPNTFRRK